MSVAVKKVPGVQSVNVTLNSGLVTIELAPGNHVTMAELRRLITSNGFSPREATVVVDGICDNRSGGSALKVDGTNEEFVLVPAANGAALDDAKQASGARVEIGGRIDPPKGPERLTVATFKRISVP